jgi:hypothetical protein
MEWPALKKGFELNVKIKTLNLLFVIIFGWWRRFEKNRFD